MLYDTESDPLLVATPIKKILPILVKNPFRRFFLKTITRALEVNLDAKTFVGSLPATHYPPSLVNKILKLQSVGILAKITKNDSYPDEPFLHSYGVFSKAQPYVSSSGADLLDDTNALEKGLGEFVERHAWRNFQESKQKEIRVSVKKIGTKGLNLNTLAGFTNKQKKKHAGLQVTDDTELLWTKGVSLTSNKATYIPVQLVSSAYTRKITFNPECQTKNTIFEPMLRWPVSTGLAAGSTIHMALRNAILEVIERDAFMISFLNKLSPPKINLNDLKSQSEKITNVLYEFEKYDLHVTLLSLPTDFSVTVILAIISDFSGNGPAMTVGASASFKPKKAILSALSEAHSVRRSIKKTFQEKNDYSKIDREGRVHFWAQEKHRNKLDFLFSGPSLDMSLSAQKENVDINSTSSELEMLINECKEKNYQIIYKRLSSKKLHKIGYNVVSVVIPELQPLHLEERIPYHGGERLSSVPAKLGYSPAKTLNKDPHPFP